MTTCQFVPFQCSTSACLDALSAYPTAQISRAETAVTPASALVFEPGLGLATTLQWEPFQCSTKVLLKVLLFPTAQISRAETAATEVRKLFCGERPEPAIT